jgi:hypothetical protein
MLVSGLLDQPLYCCLPFLRYAVSLEMTTKTMTPKSPLVKCPCPHCYLGYHEQPEPMTKTDTPLTDGQFRDATKMVPITLSIRPYSHECGDGCCYECGETWSVNEVEVASGPCEHNRMQQLLYHLGFDAQIVGQNEDGEEVWEL